MRSGWSFRFRQDHLTGLVRRVGPGHFGQCGLSGSRLDTMSEDALAKLRNREVGFIFQTFQLIPTLTALENVMVPAELRGHKGAYERASELLDQVGLGERMSHYPAQLSGGEQQRVSIARAFVNRPAMLFADEPTGNLDTDTGATIEELVFEINETAGTALLLVTHNHELAQRTGRIIRLRGGSIASDTLTRA